MTCLIYIPFSQQHKLHAGPLCPSRCADTRPVLPVARGAWNLLALTYTSYLVVIQKQDQHWGKKRLIWRTGDQAVLSPCPLVKIQGSLERDRCQPCLHHRPLTPRKSSWEAWTPLDVGASPSPSIPCRGTAPCWPVTRCLSGRSSMTGHWLNELWNPRPTPFVTSYHLINDLVQQTGKQNPNFAPSPPLPSTFSLSKEFWALLHRNKIIPFALASLPCFA